MKIAIIHETYPFGGKEEVTHNLSDFLITKDIQVYIYSCVFSEIEDEKAGISYLCFPNNCLQSSDNAEFLINEINSKKINLIIVPDYDLPDLKRIKKETDCSIVYVLHSVPFWEIELKYQLAKRRSERSFLSYIEWHTIQKIRFNILKIHKKRTEKKYREICSVVDKFVTLTDDYSNQIIKRLHIDNKELFLSISNPILQSEFLDINKKSQEVVYIGRLSYADKRIDRLLDIWKNISSDWLLRIVGDGPELIALQRKVEKEKIPRVVFEGFKSDVSDYYRKASILCLTSSFEGWPMVLGEAQSFGVVPIAFNCVAGVEDILSPDGVNGILVPPFDMELYAKQLGRLMSDDQLRLKIAEAVVLKSKEYSPDIIGKKWLDLFQTLTSK
ncbi:MAG: glycosyltransferase [Bacteroidales bacterium]